MKTYIRLILAIIVGSLVYLYINKTVDLTEAPVHIDVVDNKVEDLLNENHDSIQQEIKLAIENDYDNYWKLEIELCDNIENCYDVLDTWYFLVETKWTIKAEQWPKDLYYKIMFTLDELWKIQVQDLDISK